VREKMTYPAIFDLDEIDCRPQSIQERTNTRVNKLILSTIRVETIRIVRPTTATMSKEDDAERNDGERDNVGENKRGEEKEKEDSFGMSMG